MCSVQHGAVITLKPAYLRHLFTHIKLKENEDTMHKLIESSRQTKTSVISQLVHIYNTPDS